MLKPGAESRSRHDEGQENEEAFFEITRDWRQDSDRAADRMDAYWLAQQRRIQERIAERNERKRRWQGLLWIDGFSSGSKPARLAAAGMAVLSLVSVGLWIQVWRVGPEPTPSSVLSSQRSTESLRELFVDIGHTLATDEPMALSPAIPVRDALNLVFQSGLPAGEQPWNSTVKLHLEKELQ